ncbi:hypothetical protein [Pseudonocardia humida]|uniref:STAS domain-containing protein n=1 Tax=Pseudonocardia humida TaxID=2800819 RepID=A0ABT1A7X4_9PSEU|nr:hypothetical protein [Pseudonocardia humida]MCO1659125.1 hypothetical protein [Pseudonocardia humida]
MSGVFDVGDLADVPGPGRRGVLLTARADLDMATEEVARAQIAASVGASTGAVLLDLALVFVGAAAVRCIEDAVDRAPAVAVVGAPRWLAELVGAGIGPLPFTRTVREAVAVLRAATRGPVPPAGRTAPVHPTCGARRSTDR